MNTNKNHELCGITVCSSGDVIFLVGPREEPIIVQSQCLRNASKVFDTMFSPDWREGRNLSSANPTTVELPDDNYQAMLTICQVIHHRNDQAPQVIDPPDLLQVAIAADKYAVNIAVKFALAQWLSLRDGLGLIETGYMLAAAYRLAEGVFFQKVTLALILDQEGSFWSLLEDDMIGQVIPVKAICK